jgi:hypothetical protein
MAFLDERDVEVGDSDVARLAFAFRFCERAHRLGERNVVHGRPVDMKQVDVIDLQILQTFIDRAREIIRAQVFMRDLRHEEDVFARHARGAYARAHAFLAAVFPGGVDVSISDLQRVRNDFGAIAELRGAETDRGNTCAVRGEGRDCRLTHWFSPFSQAGFELTLPAV